MKIEGFEGPKNGSVSGKKDKKGRTFETQEKLPGVNSAVALKNQDFPGRIRYVKQ